MTPRLPCLLSVLAILSLAAPPCAHAQLRTEERVAAESLFAEGRQLLQAGDYERACAKLEASRHIEPALGTSLNLADCYEKLGRTASAWAEFRSAAAAARKAGDTLREATALERAVALEPRLSRLRVAVGDPSMSVLSNGQPLSPAVLGSAIPVDPGTYRLEASAPGKLSHVESAVVEGAGVLVEVNLPVLADEPGPRPSPPLSEPPPMTSGASEDYRTLAWALGGVGVASVATGSLFAALAASSWSKAEDSCADYPYGCTPAGVEHAGDASTRATVATVALLAGGAALGASVLLFVLDSDEPEGGAVAVGPGSVSLRGSF
jgi:tetratricopeptide (TPR) repeat protein